MHDTNAGDPFVPLADPAGDALFRYLAWHVGQDADFSSITVSNAARVLRRPSNLERAREVLRSLEAAGYVRAESDSYSVRRAAVGFTAQAVGASVRSAQPSADETMRSLVDALRGGRPTPGASAAPTRSVLGRLLAGSGPVPLDQRARHHPPAETEFETAVELDVRMAVQAGIARLHRRDGRLEADLVPGARDPLRMMCAVVPAGDWETVLDVIGGHTIWVMGALSSRRPYQDQIHMAVLDREYWDGLRDVQAQKDSLAGIRGVFAAVPADVVTRAFSALSTDAGQTPADDDPVAILDTSLRARALSSGEIERAVSKAGPMTWSAAARILGRLVDVGAAQRVGTSGVAASVTYALTPHGYFLGEALVHLEQLARDALRERTRARIVRAAGTPTAMELLRLLASPDVAQSGAAYAARLSEMTGRPVDAVGADVQLLVDARLVTVGRGSDRSLAPAPTFPARLLERSRAAYREAYITPDRRWDVPLRLTADGPSPGLSPMTAVEQRRWGDPGKWSAPMRRLLIGVQAQIGALSGELELARAPVEAEVFRMIAAHKELLWQVQLARDGLEIGAAAVAAYHDLIQVLNGRLKSAANSVWRLTFPAETLTAVGTLLQFLPDAAWLSLGETFSATFLTAADVLEGNHHPGEVMTPIRPRPDLLNLKMQAIVRGARAGQPWSNRGRNEERDYYHNVLTVGLMCRQLPAGSIARATGLGEENITTALARGIEAGVAHVSNGSFYLAPEAVMARWLIARIVEPLAAERRQDAIRDLGSRELADALAAAETLLVTGRRIDGDSLATTLNIAPADGHGWLARLVHRGLLSALSGPVSLTPFARNLIDTARAGVKALDDQVPLPTPDRPQIGEN